MTHEKKVLMLGLDPKVVDYSHLAVKLDEATLRAGLAADEGIGGGPGHADLAGFFEEFEARAVGNPAALVGEEEHGGKERGKGNEALRH